MKPVRKQRPRNHFARELLTDGRFRPRIVDVKKRTLPRKRKHRKDLSNEDSTN